MSVRLADVVTDLATLAGVTASLASAEDGLLLHGAAAPGVPLRAMAALVPSLYRRASRCSSISGFGAPTLVRIEGESGDILACGRGEVILILVTARGANLGRLRLDLRSAAERLG